MTNQFEGFLTFSGNDGDFCILLDQEGCIDKFTIYLAGQCGFGQTGADVCGYIVDRDGLIEVTGRAVGKGNLRHWKPLSVATRTKGRLVS